MAHLARQYPCTQFQGTWCEGLTLALGKGCALVFSKEDTMQDHTHNLTLSAASWIERIMLDTQDKLDRLSQSGHGSAGQWDSYERAFHTLDHKVLLVWDAWLASIVAP
jgi:hypothetical protein